MTTIHRVDWFRRDPGGGTLHVRPDNPRQPAYGTCPGCGYRRAMKADGTMRSHHRLTPQGYNAGQCSGVDKPPTEES